MSKKLTLIFCLILPACSSEVFQEYSLGDLVREGAIKTGVLQPGVSGEGETLEIVNETEGEMRIPILILKNLHFPKHPYAVEGMVLGEGISPSAFFEMWSVFPDETQFFSRTLDPKGPMGILEGTFDWRVFQLPFFKGDSPGDPTEIRLNIVFQGTGKISLRQLKLVHFVSGQTATKAPGVWWSDRTGGWVGGIVGCVLGLAGALMGFLGRRTGARRFVLAGLVTLLVLGMASLAIGVLAVILGQPFGVFYLLLFGGGLAVILGGGLLVSIRRAMIFEEMRRMRAMDTGV